MNEEQISYLIREFARWAVAEGDQNCRSICLGPNYSSQEAETLVTSVQRLTGVSVEANIFSEDNKLLEVVRSV